MKRIFYLILLMTIVSFSACKTSPEDTSNQSALEEPKNLLKVEEPGFEMGIFVPEEYLTNHPPMVAFNDDIGLLEIQVGENFQMEISDHNTNLTDFKESLKREMMFEYKISNESKDGFVFQSFLPDGTEYSSNFIQQFELNGKVYTVKNKKDQEFSLDQIMKMKETILNVKTI